MRGIESKEAILVELLNDHIDGLNSGAQQDLSEEIASLPIEDQAELHSLFSIDRLLRMVASADKVVDESFFRLSDNAR
jgi:hypothetical protein